MFASGTRPRDLRSRVTDANAVTSAVVLADPGGPVPIAFAERVRD